ncbi:hypothetical protein B0H14DRAFT_2611520 [Mycena olivaceomarginata]|nr:hypothetical protein B0H14DRAFT_2611520 [Mycena olivaceomarginata]
MLCSRPRWPHSTADGGDLHAQPRLSHTFRAHLALTRNRLPPPHATAKRGSSRTQNTSLVWLPQGTDTNRPMKTVAAKPKEPAMPQYDPLRSEYFPESLTHGPSGSWCDAADCRTPGTSKVLAMFLNMTFINAPLSMNCTLFPLAYALYTLPIRTPLFSARGGLFWTHSWLRARKNGTARSTFRLAWSLCDILGGNLLFSPQNAKKSKAHSRNSAAVKAARRDASRTYRWKNEEVLREKARVRMAAHRASITAEGQVSEDYAAGVKQAHTNYRSKHRDLLACKARLRRQNAFVAKHGWQALLDRIAKERARADAAWEAQQAEIERQRQQKQAAAAAARQLSSATAIQISIFCQIFGAKSEAKVVHRVPNQHESKSWQRLWLLMAWKLGNIKSKLHLDYVREHGLNKVKLVKEMKRRNTNAQVFSDIGTPVRLSALVDMSTAYQGCLPPYHPSPGHEDPREHSVAAGRYFYTVGVGYAPGILHRRVRTNNWVSRAFANNISRMLARNQVSGFSDTKWKKSPTYEGTLAIWNDMCERYHNHDASPPPSPPSPPSPSPPSQPVTRSSPRKTPIRPRAPAPVMRAPASPRRPGVPLVSTPMPTRTAAGRLSQPPLASSSGSGLTHLAPPVQVESSRERGAWREGEILWGIAGTFLLFEDRHRSVDPTVTLETLAGVRDGDAQPKEIGCVRGEAGVCACAWGS